jgi:hypothetical protein
MRRAAAISLCLILCGCGSSDEKPTGLDVRQLSDVEKQGLARALSQKLSDPGGAQFKWMPVLGTPVEGSKWVPSFSSSKPQPPVSYCGLVSERGGPFRVFSATIGQSGAGQYDRGNMDNVDASASGGHGPVEERCRTLGYSDFTLAR